ncbi:SigE family RNA polymerase sigma factor [Actinomadura graeca]|uniref:SigE family RNA polymerase sigma factor n=2 Tax=Actinomadura graeca TaxID=2750812 RepID=A0ABX8R7J2_9ACTN|nr:SigE family RNA polymerase sigma factor [Actinomadura graeca]
MARTARGTARGTAVPASDEREYVEYVTGALPGLRRIAHLLCRDPHRADDVVQAALTRLYVHWRRARAADDVDRYVRAILVRSFLSERRLAWARVRLTGAPADTPGLASAPDPDVETREEVRAALARVPRRQRAVLVLRFLCDLPVAEVAEILGCSEGTVKSQTAHGLARLRALMGGRAAAVAAEPPGPGRRGEE